MAERISIDDANRMYAECLCLFKGELTYLQGVDQGYRALIRDVLTNKLRYEQFSLEDFTSPNTGRLGYMNFGGSAFYIHRAPRRVYRVGWSMENIEPLWGDFRYSEVEKAALQRAGFGLYSGEILNTYKNIYPSFSEAVKAVKGKDSKLVAFDRMFAVSYKSGIYYKGEMVGNVNLGGNPQIEDIQWLEGKESLVGLIGNRFKLGV